jgi:tetratricopeptide (TPR) repeat protein
MREASSGQAKAAKSPVVRDVAKPAVAMAPALVAVAPQPAALPEETAVEVDSETEAVDSDASESDANESEATGAGAVDPARARANRFVNAGHRLRKEGRLGMAEASYLKALEAMPKYARAVSGLVTVHLARRDGVEAVRWARKLVALQGQRGAHHRLLGDAYALSGAKDPARKSWQQAVKLGDRAARARL